MSESIIREKSFNFAVRIIKLSQYLQKQGDFVLARQLLRSGTSIGANVREAKHAESKADFVHKMNIALKKKIRKEGSKFLNEFWFLGEK